MMRKATKNDLQGLINLYSQLLPKDNITEDIANTVFDSIINDDNYYILVLEENGNIVSTCTLVLIKNITHESKSFAIIENVITDENYRENGYGKIVINKAIEIARKKQCHKIMLQTRRKEEYVMNFYKNCGFSAEISKGFMINLEDDVYE